MSAFQKVYEEYAQPVYRFLLSLSCSEDLAEELLQETFFLAFQHIDQFEGRCNLYTWLCQIGKNVWIKECRRNKRYSEISWDELTLPASGLSLEELVNIKEDGLAKFCELGGKLEELGGIEEYRYIGTSIYSYEDVEQKIPSYRLEYKIFFNKKWQSFTVYVSEGAVEYLGGGGSLWSDPLAAFSSWTEFLWQDYAGCYYDTELKQYVYYDEKE